MSQGRGNLIYVIAGEASGDILGARLIAALRARRPDLHFAGIGGPAMARQGVFSLFPMRELALVGLVEILPKLRALRARLHETVADIALRQPALVVTIDSPGFSLRILKHIRTFNAKRAHYVAPQAWAWRERRVRKFPGLWDELLCLLPFEPEFFARHSLPARFVGHPVLESGVDQGDGTRFRTAHGLAVDRPILVIMPGSRASEIDRHLPIMAETFHLLLKQLPGLIPVIPVAERDSNRLAAATAYWSARPILVRGDADKHDAFAAATGALSKSGTSTLELALAQVPMIVTYRVHGLTAAVARRLVKVRYASIVNLLADRAVLPEFIQQDCTAQKLAAALLPLLTDPAAAQAQRDAVWPFLEMLRPPDGERPSEAAASVLLALLEKA